MMPSRTGPSGLDLSILRSLQQSDARLARSNARLASGLRIQQAADDPAGLALSERFRAEIGGLARARLNVRDGLSLTQPAQSGLSEISNLLIEARGLALQSANGTLADELRGQLDLRFQSLLEEVDRIAETTGLGSARPLADETASVSLAVGAGADDLLTVSGVDARAAALGIDELDVATASAARESLDPLDAALDRVQTLAARFGGAENRLDSLSRVLAARIESTSAADSRIRDLDFAEETARRIRDQILQQSALALLGQNGAGLGTMLRLLV